MQVDFSLFEPLHETSPLRLVAAHPTEPFVALEIAFAVDDRRDNPSLRDIHIAIWNSETYELVSVLENAVTLAWNVDGSEMGLIRKYREYDPEWKVYVSKYIWEHLSWPDQKVLSSCDLAFVTSWPECIVFSPSEDLAIVQWFEVDKSGLEFIDLAGGESQLVDVGISHVEREVEAFEEEEDLRFFVDTNLVTRPIFSPDGRYIIFGWQRHQRWWTDIADDVYVEGEVPARVGECHMGYIQVVDGGENATHMIGLFVTLPPGWQPSYEGDLSNELLSDPVFITDEHFQLLLPTGETRVYSVRAGK